MRRQHRRRPSVAVAECRHVSLYIAPGGKISFIFTACVNPTDRPRPSVRPSSDLETKTRHLRARALLRRDFNRKRRRLPRSRRRRRRAVLSIVYFSRQKPAAIYEPDRTLELDVCPALRPAKPDKYVCRSPREGKGGGYHKYPLYLWISPDAVRGAFLREEGHLFRETARQQFQTQMSSATRSQCNEDPALDLGGHLSLLIRIPLLHDIFMGRPRKREKV